MVISLMTKDEASGYCVKNVKACIVVIVIGWCLINVSTAVAQSNFSGFKQGGLLTRIERGDYVWSLDFPQKEARLLGYGKALANSVRDLCSEYHELPDEEAFAGGWIMANFLREGAVGPGLHDTVRSATGGLAVSPAAQADAEQLVNNYGCDASETKQVMDNAARMLAGRRPMHGQPRGSSLIAEQVGPVSGKHQYKHSSEGLQSPGMIQLEHDMRQVSAGGFQVLECHYDTDPEDEYYEVQYYWSLGLASVAHLTGTLPMLITTMQRNLQRANGIAKVRHPFLDYASPRAECPSSRDPRLPVKQIYAKRKPLDRPIPENFAKPVIREKGGDTIYDYGVVPESFVPTIPADIPQTTTRFEMKKEHPGSLIQMEISTIGWNSLNRSDSDYKDRPREKKMLEEDVGIAFKVRGKVLECVYLTEQHGTGHLYRFWYKDRPVVAEPTQLKSRIHDHPMLEIRSPQQTCPATPDRAEGIQ